MFKDFNWPWLEDLYHPYALALLILILATIVVAIIIHYYALAQHRLGKLEMYCQLFLDTDLESLPDNTYYIRWWKKYLNPARTFTCKKEYFFLEIINKKSDQKSLVQNFYVITAYFKEERNIIKYLAKNGKMLLIKDGKIENAIVRSSKKQF